MSTIITMGRILYRVLSFALMTLWQLSCLRFRLFFAPLSKARSHRNRALKAWAESTLRIFAFSLEIIGEQPPQDGPRLVLANHRSPFDIPAVLFAIQTRTMGQAAVSKWPLIGSAARAGDTIFVDRQDKESGKQAIAGARQALLEEDAVLIFPEGTTFEGDELRPFKLGGISAGQDSNALIIPVGICYEEGFGYDKESLGSYLKRVAGQRRCKLTVAIGAAITPQATVEQTAQATHEAITTLIHQARTSLEHR
ncbi:MAG: 1-acyl-sn-glycerol-3-phosphate acyltransferase [Myxococcales bacterium]|nr:MAG: 1-acyl-sn-glycerol-3-phosphate acyltransferase [Myxococcales bacterium]